MFNENGASLDRIPNKEFMDLVIGKRVEWENDAKANLFGEYFDTFLADKETAISSIYTLKYVCTYDMDSLDSEEKICVMQDRIKSFLSRTILDEREFEHSQMPESMAFALMSPSEFEQMREKKSAIETLSKVYAENSEIIENASNLGRFKFITFMMNDNKVLNGEKLSESEQMLNDWVLCNLDEIQGEKEAN